MAHIENHTDHQFDITVKVGEEDQVIQIPRSNGESGAARVAGNVEVSDEVVKAIQGHRVAKTWFESGDLSIGKARAHKAPAEEEKPAHRK